MIPEVQHDPEGGSFHARTEHGEARLDYRWADRGTLDLRHTFVPEEDRGRGIAGRLVEHALEYATQERLRVIPTCPFVRAWIEKNPAFRHLVADS